MPAPRPISWFSCGASSAVATKIFLANHPEARVAYCASTLSTEHPDNLRFLLDCEQWFGVEIERLYSAKYQDTWDVYAKTGWLVGTQGARCTTELKKRVRQDNSTPDAVQVFGFDAAERSRFDRFRSSNPDVFSPKAPLIDAGFYKADVMAALGRAGIQIPAMYAMGYGHNNCLGCVKGQAGYWNKIRVDFPSVFDRMAKVERELDVAICKTEPVANGQRQRLRIFLDELDPGAGIYRNEPAIQCDLFCNDAAAG